MRRSSLAALLLSALLVTHERAMVAAQTPATPLTLNVSQTELQSGRYALGAVMTTGTSACGPNGVQVTNWTIRLEQDYSRPIGTNVVTTTGGRFVGGTLTVPRSGIYWFSIYGRCERQACDCTMRANGARIAAFGTDLTERWENRVGRSDGPIGSYWTSHGVSTICYVAANTQIQMFMESGQGNDCLYETGWFYGQFSALQLWNDVQATTTG